MDYSYGSLANYYDQLTTDVNYEEWAKYLDTHLQKHQIPGKIVLDLACGTGTLTFELAKLGYEMIGVDLSPDMLSQAMEKAYEFEGTAPLFLCQSMDELDLYGTIDACVCCLDSVNYITDPNMLKKAMERVFLFLMVGGVFIFDIRTVDSFLAQNGSFSLDETEDVYCVWRTEVEEATGLCTHGMDLFQRSGSHWLREAEVHKQRLYTLEVLENMLKEVGFSQVDLFAPLSMDTAKGQEERVFFLAQKNK